MTNKDIIKMVVMNEYINEEMIKYEPKKLEDFLMDKLTDALLLLTNEKTNHIKRDI